jgi:hypothetical protein
MIPATTPPECVSNLLRTCCHEISQQQRRVRWKDTLIHISSHEAHDSLKRYFDLLEIKEVVPSMVDQFTTATLNELDFWKRPRMVLAKLPDLKPSDMVVDETY